ncbi:MAG: hypothetical protein VX204_04480 [Candidatus Thermoplasmatota archaeon]|nr:hypothetical protein [Candidatus Thermoplasmatota archaeon]MEE3270349.1 hypothetical protein [Candidatus Thermoplasmatota archaeon]
MVDWSDSEFLALLLIDVVAIFIAVWWLSTKFTSKVREVEERSSRGRLSTHDKSEEE